MDLQQNLKEKQGNLKHLIQIRKPEAFGRVCEREKHSSMDYYATV